MSNEPIKEEEMVNDLPKRITASFRLAVETFLDDSLDEHDHKLCEDTIRCTLNYINAKRKHVNQTGKEF
jgi:hypothetical protein